MCTKLLSYQIISVCIIRIAGAFLAQTHYTHFWTKKIPRKINIKYYKC